MAKTVFENSMVAHVWAQLKQPSGRSSNGNFYFDGAALYSYGRHFCAGFITEDVNGSKVALINSNNYSMSTAKHLNYARRAVSHMRSFTVDNPNVGRVGFQPTETRKLHLANLAAMQKNATETRAKAGRARSNKEWLLKSADGLDAECVAYAEAFGLAGIVDAGAELVAINGAERLRRTLDRIAHGRGRLDAGRHRLGIWRAAEICMEIKNDCEQANILAGDMVARKKSAHRLNKFELAILDRAKDCGKVHWMKTGDGLQTVDYRIENFEAFDKARELVPLMVASWRATGSSTTQLETMHHGHRQAWFKAVDMFRDLGPLMRVDGDEIVTSAGARFPVSHGLKAFPLIERVKASGKAWERGETGPNLGHFQIDAITATGDVKAGCHFVRWSEIAACYAELKARETVDA